MTPVVGVFASRKQAQDATERLSERGLQEIMLLTPGDWQAGMRHVRTEETEERGMGAALFGVVGGALGAAAGLALGTLTAAFSLEILSVVILGSSGVAAGVAAGRALEASLSDGLSSDELSTYKHALLQGRSVVIAYSNRSPSARAVRAVMVQSGAESLDAAWRKSWFGPRPFERQPDRADV